MTRAAATAVFMIVTLAVSYLMAWGLFGWAGGYPPTDPTSRDVKLLAVLVYGVILSPLAWVATLPLQYALYRAARRQPQPA